MKNPRFVVVFLAVMGLAGLALGAGCGPHAAPAAVPDSISVNTLDGGEGVPVDGTFKYVFSRPVNTLTVTASTFFIVKNEVSSSLNKAVVEEGICDSTQALDVSVGCSSPAECTLTPAELLEYSTTYSICLTGNMQYATGEQFGSFMATFTAEVEGPLDLNSLDGAVDVAVDSSFRYRFLKEVDTSTVDTSKYFIVPTPAAASISKADVDSTICDAANAVTSEITCTRWTWTIAPSEYLEYITGYTACLASGISYTSSSGFNGFMAGFTTSAEPITPWNISSIKLVRLDDTELELTDKPIPRMVSVSFTLSRAVTDESERATFESSVSLVDANENTVEGTYEWADDYLSVTFTPSRRLEYKTEYTINVDTSILPLLSFSKALSAGDLAFTTMTFRDINGDGFADVIVGAWGYPDGDNKGRAYVYLGSASGISDCDLSDPTCVPHATITGKHDSDYLGWTPSVIGDVNADGFADIIVSASGYTGVGRAYVFLGSANGINDCDLSNPSCIPDAFITGDYVGDEFGMVSNAGDINGDGYDDIIVGAGGYPEGNWHGRAYIFLGSGSGIADCDLSAACVADTTITWENNWDYLGYSVSTAGDVNGDGYDDIIVGAYGYPVGAEKGRVYVFLGSGSGIADCDLGGGCTADATITGENNGDSLGFSVSNAGDVDGDGYDDVIVGAGNYDGGGGNQSGRAYVFFGGSTLSGDLGAANADATITGENQNDWLGQSVSGGGDINADGYADVIVGAPAYDGGGSYKGRAYVFLGSGSGIADCDLSAGGVPDTTITGKSDKDTSGTVSNAGDVNGNGYDDIIIGTEYYRMLKPVNHKGPAYIFMGSGSGISDCDLSGACTADTTFTGEGDNDMFGSFK